MARTFPLLMPADLSPAHRPPRRPRWLGSLALFAGVALFALGLLRLFALRFEAGDVYPFYSTLRSDALGAKAFYAALEALPDGPRVERNYRALTRLLRPPALKSLLGQPAASTPAPAAAAATQRRQLGAGDRLFLLGTNPRMWPFTFTKDEADEIEAAAKRGARIVLAFAPSEGTPLGGAARLRRKDPATQGKRTGKSDDQTRTGDDRKKRVAGDSQPEKGKKPPNAKKDNDSIEDNDRDEPEPDEDAIDVAERWAIDFRRVATDADAKADAKRQRERAFPAVPVRGRDGDESLAAALAGEPPISWHSAADFELSKKRADPPKGADGMSSVAAASAGAWRALLLRDDRPVLVERRYPESGGSIVLASDSFFLSNEALRAERHPALLAWLVGGSGNSSAIQGRVIFDESHLRLREAPGLMTLARRYRLGGALAALALLAVLFIWKSVSSLAPPRVESNSPATAATADGIAGRAAAAGFSSLLRRGVPAAELLEVCVTRWQAAQAGRAITTAAGGHGRVSAEKVERLRAIAAAERAKPGRARSPAAAYREMCEVLKKL